MASKKKAADAAMAAEGNPEPAREVPQRAPPVTLDDHLARAYAARFRLEGSDSEDMALVVRRLSTGLPDDQNRRPPKAPFTRAALIAERDRLARVEDRCTVSRTHREVLDLAIAEMPDE